MEVEVVEVEVEVSAILTHPVPLYTCKRELEKRISPVFGADGATVFKRPANLLNNVLAIICFLYKYGEGKFMATPPQDSITMRKLLRHL